MDETNLPEEQEPVTPDFGESTESSPQPKTTPEASPTPEIQTPFETETSPKKSKKGVIFAVAAALVVLLAAAAGAYYYFVYAADEAPPSLSTQSALQGFIGSKDLGFGGWETADMVEYEERVKLGISTEINQGVNWFHADKDMSLKEIMKGISPDSEAFALGMYDAEEGMFYLFPKTGYYNQEAIISVTDDPVELAADLSAMDPEDVVVPTGTAFVYVSQKASEGYGFDDGTVAGSMDSHDLCSMKEGWNLVAAPDKDLKSFVAPCLDAIKYIYIQDGTESFEKVYKKGSATHGEDNIGQLSDHYLVWIKFDTAPVYTVPTVDVAVCGNDILEEGEECDGSENCTDECVCAEGYDALNGDCFEVGLIGTESAVAGEACDGETILCAEGLICTDGFCAEEEDEVVAAVAGETCDETILCAEGLICTDGVCVEEEVPAVCGDKTLDEGEECDGVKHCTKECVCEDKYSPEDGECVVPVPENLEVEWTDMAKAEFAFTWDDPLMDQGKYIYSYEVKNEENETVGGKEEFAIVVADEEEFKVEDAIKEKYWVDGQTYTFELKILYPQGEESEVVSDEITYTAPEDTAIEYLAPEKFEAEWDIDEKMIILTWEAPADTQALEAYELSIYYNNELEDKYKVSKEKTSIGPIYKDEGIFDFEILATYKDGGKSDPVTASLILPQQ